jgi:hypothetical protein
VNQRQAMISIRFFQSLPTRARTAFRTLIRSLGAAQALRSQSQAFKPKTRITSAQIKFLSVANGSSYWALNRYDRLFVISAVDKETEIVAAFALKAAI